MKLLFKWYYNSDFQMISNKYFVLDINWIFNLLTNYDH